ncbi:hypothetical protein FLM48_14095 [Shewanella sp. Scap07]|uniref:hypothetical protein n=1 Tax=Shewanella sp. Scap07 TaxID=2589987 RepID=UPI0015BBE8A0|nr:hypothetical protein [Shewanella sp. Scap07]QLE86098.1 hypothetical protein FLM48_14095 [Shewanella sp. Scap07]
MQRSNQNTEAELELALLQIAQLQEELEYYYIEYNRLKEVGGQVSPLIESSPAMDLLRKARNNDHEYLLSSDCSFADKLKARIANLEKINRQQAKEIDHFEMSLETDSQCNQEQNSKNSQLEGEFKTSEVRLDSHKPKSGSDREIFEQEKAGLASQVSQLQSENELNLMHVAQLQEELETFRCMKLQNSDVLEIENSKLEGELKRLQSKHNVLEDTKLQLFEQHSELSNETNELKQKIEQVEAERATFKTQLKQQKQEWEEMHLTLESNYFHLKKQFEKLQIENNSIHSLNAALETEVATYVDESESLKSTIVGLQIELDENKLTAASIAELESRYSNLESENAQLIQKMELLEEQASNQQAEHQLQLGKSAEELASSVGEKAEFEQSLVKLESEVVSLRAQNKEIQILNERNAQLEKDNQELNYRQTVLDTEITKAETQLEFIKDVVIREKSF